RTCHIFKDPNRSGSVKDIEGGILSRMLPRIQPRRILGLVICFSVAIGLFGRAKTSPQTDQNLPEMLVTDDGFLAINTPNGWIRAMGPGLAFFVREGDTDQTAKVWIYI